LVNGVNPITAKMFKSALYPALIDFHVETTLPMIGEADLGGHSNSAAPQQISGATKGLGIGNLDHLSHFKVIVKTGDDLRQDQLVIMLIQLMDGLLKRAALNLCLTPYSILAVSPTSGLVEFVDGSMPISQILSNYNGSILQYFQDVAPQKGAKYDVRPDVISTYVRSCAGYCVITFLLAVGDRHLDNILLDSSGHFFHIDFGFIFGRDPKPLPPPFRLTREVSWSR
jgi:phosphatidylinositol 3-kinase